MSFVLAAIGQAGAGFLGAYLDDQERRSRRKHGLPPREPEPSRPVRTQASDDITPLFVGVAVGAVMSHTTHDTSPSCSPDTFSSGGGGDFGGGGADGSF